MNKIMLLFNEFMDSIRPAFAKASADSHHERDIDNISVHCPKHDQISINFRRIDKNSFVVSVLRSSLERSRMYRTMNSMKAVALAVLISFCSFPNILSLSVGSNTTFSRQPLTNFPTGATNTMLGFAAFDGGFGLADQNTTCTYNDFFPISGPITMNDGLLLLLQDLVLSNSFDIDGAGKFSGSGHNIELAKQYSDIFYPKLTSAFSVKTTGSATMGAAVQSLDWSMNDTYLAACSLNSPSTSELKIFYYDGSSLTQTAASEIGRDANCARWNQKSNYVALGRVGVSNEELRVYRWNISNGKLTITDTRDFGNKEVSAVAWHPSGLYLAAGSAANNQQVQAYSFSLTTGLLSDLSPGGTINLSAADRKVTRNSLSWNPGGNYLSIGTATASPGGAELMVASFDTVNLTVTTSVFLNIEVDAVDWSPTGTYIAVGLGGGSQRLRIYQHGISPQSLTEVLSARVGESNTVDALHWDPTGNFLLVGIVAGISSNTKLYFFDKTNLTLTLINTIPSTSAINALRWKHTGDCFARGDAANKIFISCLGATTFQFKDLTFVLNSDLVFTRQVFFTGQCKINGRGAELTINDNSECIIQPRSQLIFEDLTIKGLKNNKIRCITDNSSVIFRNCVLFLDSDFTFSRGSILFDHEVDMFGNAKFIYTTGLSSTIASHATLYMSQGMTFSYAPRTAKKTLLNMADETSQLYLDGCTVVSTRTGLQLSRGILAFDNKVTLSSQARYAPESLSLKSNLNIRMLGGANVNLNGIITYDT